MNLTKPFKLILNIIPGYRERVLERKTQQLNDAKAKLLKAAVPSLKFNVRLQKPEYVYSQGVQSVLARYQQELRSLEPSPANNYTAATGTHPS